jgi:hypothetical protein
MKTEDIIRMAREANLGNVLCHNSVEGDRVFIEGADWHDEVERFAALVAAAESERWSRLLEDRAAACERAAENTGDPKYDSIARTLMSVRQEGLK